MPVATDLQHVPSPLMTQLSRSASPAAALPSTGVRRSLLSNYLELTKARLSMLVVFTTAVGFVLASTAGTAIAA